MDKGDGILKKISISQDRKNFSNKKSSARMMNRFQDVLQIPWISSKHDSIKTERFYINILNTLRLFKIIIKIYREHNI